MNKLKNIKSYIGLVIILSIFIICFLLVSNFYSLRNKSSSIQTLDKDLFTTNTSSNEEQALIVDKITKFTIPYPITYYDFLDINTIAFININKEKKTPSNITGIYDLNKNMLTYKFDTLNTTYPNNISISKDGKMLLVSYNSITNTNPKKIYIYDTSTRELLRTFPDALCTSWLPDNSGYIGIDDYIFIQDVKNNKRTNLLELTDIMKKALFNKDCKFKLSEDSLSAYIGCDNTLFIVDIKTKEIVNLPLKSSIVCLSDKNIVLMNQEKTNDYGLYLYNIKDKSYNKLITSTKLINKNIDISPDGKKIAYTLLSENNKTEIHSSYIDNNKLVHDSIIYKDSEGIYSIKWSKDSQMLYCISSEFISNKKELVESGSNNSLIYRISFKNH